MKRKSYIPKPTIIDADLLVQHEKIYDQRCFMNIYDNNFKDKLKKYEVVAEITSAETNRTTKEIVLELSKESRITVNLVSGEGHPIKMNFKGNTFFDMLNDYCSDEELDNSILINSEIYLEIKGLLKADYFKL